MEINQLRYVVKVAQCHSFTRAAEELFVTQPTLSQQIAKLEQELELPLFVRTTRSIALTSAGEDFIQYAQRIIENWDELKYAMKCHLDLEQGKILVGILPTSDSLNLTSHIASFLENYSGVRIEFVEAWSEELMERVMAGALDVAFLKQPDAESVARLSQELLFYPLLLDSVALVVSRDHPLAGRKSVSLEELVSERLLMCIQHSSMNKVITAAFRQHDITLHVMCECPSVDMLVGLVSSGLGISFLTWRVAESYGGERLAIVPIEPPIASYTSMTLSKRHQHSPITLAFRDYILSKFSSGGKV